MVSTARADIRSNTIPVPERVKVTMRLIAEAAAAGKPCPTNNEISAAIGATSQATAAGVMLLLETMNLIRIERGRSWRIVTIVSTGQTTADRKLTFVPAPQRRPGPSPEVRARAQQKIEENRRKRIALFCDALGEGASIKEAGRVAGVSEPTARSMFYTVCDELGVQAQ